MSYKKEEPCLISQVVINKLMDWLICGDVGQSSKCMAATIMSKRNSLNNKQYEALQHPRDSSDFYRCVKLLNTVPEMRLHLDEMRHVSPYWNVLVDHWVELEILITQEIAALRESSTTHLKGSTYKRIKEVYQTADAVFTN